MRSHVYEVLTLPLRQDSVSKSLYQEMIEQSNDSLLLPRYLEFCGLAPPVVALVTALPSSYELFPVFAVSYSLRLIHHDQVACTHHGPPEDGLDISELIVKYLRSSHYPIVPIIARQWFEIGVWLAPQYSHLVEW